MLDLSSRKVYGALAEQCVGGDAKADKVETAVAGHLAGLDGNGNLTDSGVSPTEDVTVEGNPVTFESPFEQDAKSVVVSVKPIQAGSGTPSPENIRPISGIDEVEIGVSGKNRAKSVYGVGTVRIYDVALYIDTDFQRNTDYVLSLSNNISGIEMYLNEGLNIGSRYFNSNTNRYSITFHIGDDLPSSQQYTPGKGWLMFKYNTTSDQTLTFDDVQLELGTTPTEYEPYNPNSHTTTIPLPSTLYDADVDMTNGDADNRKGFVEFDGTEDVSWQLNDANPNYTHIFADVSGYIANIPTTGGQLANTLFNEFKNKDGEWVAGLADLENGWLNMTLPKGTVSNVNDFKAWLAQNPLQICYELATTTTLSLTPTDVELLEGTNVVSTNAEKVAVTYGRSLWQDIDELKTDTEGKLNKSDVADVEGDIASRPYAVNEFMLRSDGLYKVTQPIAQNASITASNTTKTTIGAVLTALLNA